MNLVSITSAIALTAAQQQKIEQKLRIKLKGTELSFNYRVNPDLLGGLSVNIGDKLYDASLRAKLRQLADQLQS